MEETEQPCVMLVEDDLILRSTLSFNLAREGYRVRTAESGERALEAIRQQGNAPDLMILDVMLPGLNGFGVLQEVRRRGLQVPVLMLSARGEEQDTIDGLELGADDYIVKPFSLRELKARVRAVLRRRAAPATRPPEVLQRGLLRIEPNRHRASVGTNQLRLRPKEFGLLVALALEPGRVFDRQELLSTIWGNDVIVDDRTVDVHISWLRGKLRNAGLKDPGIRTVYGSGYCFEMRDDAGPPASSPSEHHGALI